MRMVRLISARSRRGVVDRPGSVEGRGAMKRVARTFRPRASPGYSSDGEQSWGTFRSRSFLPSLRLERGCARTMRTAIGPADGRPGGWGIASIGDPHRDRSRTIEPEIGRGRLSVLDSRRAARIAGRISRLRDAGRLLGNRLGGRPTSGVAGSVASTAGGSAGLSGVGSGASPRTYLPGPTLTHGTGTDAAWRDVSSRLRPRTRPGLSRGDPGLPIAGGFGSPEPDASTRSSDPLVGGQATTSGLVRVRGTPSGSTGRARSLVGRGPLRASRCHATSAK